MKWMMMTMMRMMKKMSRMKGIKKMMRMKRKRRIKNMMRRMNIRMMMMMTMMRKPRMMTMRKATYLEEYLDLALQLAPPLNAIAVHLGEPERDEMGHTERENAH